MSFPQKNIKRKIAFPVMSTYFLKPYIALHKTEKKNFFFRKYSIALYKKVEDLSIKHDIDFDRKTFFSGKVVM